MQLNHFSQNSTWLSEAKAHSTISSKYTFFSFLLSTIQLSLPLHSCSQMLCKHIFFKTVCKYVTAFMAQRFHCSNTLSLWFAASPSPSIEKQPPIAYKREINIAEINTTLSISPFCLRKAVELWPASKVVQSKMSNLPLGLLLCHLCCSPLARNMMRGLDRAGSEVRAWVRAWVL